MLYIYSQYIYIYIYILCQVFEIFFSLWILFLCLNFFTLNEVKRKL